MTWQPAHHARTPQVPERLPPSLLPRRSTALVGGLSPTRVIVETADVVQQQRAESGLEMQLHLDGHGALLGELGLETVDPAAEPVEVVGSGVARRDRRWIAALGRRRFGGRRRLGAVDGLEKLDDRLGLG